MRGSAARKFNYVLKIAKMLEVLIRRFEDRIIDNFRRSHSINSEIKIRKIDTVEFERH